ncbi:AAA family ATPase [Williamsia herbipolensis]|uniref:AAA family ATPase n=1 Tax=Williamsia herbipolensis TaxID=1603258 RepID=UPI001EF07B77|nr:AAA family ATPase [Williamsia herbipolensis]
MTAPTHLQNDRAIDRCRNAFEAMGLQWTAGSHLTASAQAPGHSAADRSVTFRQIEGCVLVNSFADDKDAVLEAVGLSLADLYDDASGARYDYPDGRVVYRSPAKKFRQSGNVLGRALFHADRLPADTSVTVYVVEGEKDVLTAESHGLVAVSGAMGAGKARHFDWTVLAHRPVVVVADKDEPGLKHARAVVELVESVAATVCIVEAVGDCKDLTDHLMAGEDVSALVERRRSGRHLRVIRGSDVTMQKLEWWEPDLIPMSSLTLLAGREGKGKSTIACDWAARETRAGNSVLYLHSEDSREHTVTPRLVAAGADLTKVLFIDVETETTDAGNLILPVDVPALDRVVAANDVTLIVLDAATSSMSADLSGNDDRQVRRFLEPLARLAGTRRVVVLGLVHFGKREGVDSGKLILGSIAWSQVARSVLSLADDPETGNLIITNTKGNLASRVRSVECRLESRSVMTAGGPTEVGRVEWLGDTNHDARDFLVAEGEDHEERNEVQAVIVDYLRDVGGSAPAAEVLRITRAAGLIDNVVKKARRKAGVRTKRVGFGKDSAWIWSLNDTEEAQSPTGSGDEQ